MSSAAQQTESATAANPSATSHTTSVAGSVIEAADGLGGPPNYIRIQNIASTGEIYVGALNIYCETREVSKDTVAEILVACFVVLISRTYSSLSLSLQQIWESVWI